MKFPDKSAIGSSASTTSVANAAFVPIGVVTVLLGPMLPILSSQWSLNYEQSGSLFTAQFLGSTVAVSLSGFVISRWGFGYAMKAGLLVMALGIGGLALSSRNTGFIFIAGYGIGLGIAIPAINLLVAALNGERRSAALSRLNFWWSVGAVACPFLVAAAARSNQVKLFLFLLAVVLLLAMLRIAFAPFFLEPAPAETVQSSAQLPGPLASMWNWRAGIVFAALFFLYVGTENAFGGWIAAYAKGLGTTSAAVAALTPSFFYAALTVGRWIGPGALRWKPEITIARACLGIAGVGMAALVLSPTIPSLVLSVVVAGLGLAVVYPITISRMSQEFGDSASQAGSVMFTMANLGGASMPWLVGYLSHRWSSLGMGLAVPLIGTVVMLLIMLIPSTPDRPQSDLLPPAPGQNCAKC